MLADDTKSKIEDITSGVIVKWQTNNCTSIRNLLCASFPTSTTVKTAFESNTVVKEEQAKLIQEYCRANNLLVATFPDENTFLAAGGEAKVYFNSSDSTVTKFNDGVYYATWLEFLNSILLHNLIFENTSYSLLGFCNSEDKLFAVLNQKFVACDAQADLGDIRQFLEFNGFENTRRQDYENRQLGLLLEDMHDENVLVSHDTLFFIDSVFYTIAIEQK